MRIGSLFSGIGGLELGLERATGGRTIWQVEIDPWCRRILAQHWPCAERFADVSQVTVHDLAPVDLLCGGFPCQDVSAAGKGAGLAGARSGLWYEYRRILAELRPRFVVIENVASGARRWVPTILEQVGELGYRARAYALSAADIGAPHLRRRVFVVATLPDAHGVGLRQQQGWSGGEGGGGKSVTGDTGEPRSTLAAARGMSVANRDGDRRKCERGRGLLDGERETLRDDAHRRDRTHAWPPLRGDDDGWREWIAAGGPPAAVPRLRRAPDGFPGGVDRDRRARLRALGNAVVPQCAEVIGRIVLEVESTGEFP